MEGFNCASNRKRVARMQKPNLSYSFIDDLQIIGRIVSGAATLGHKLDEASKFFYSRLKKLFP